MVYYVKYMQSFSKIQQSCKILLGVDCPHVTIINDTTVFRDWSHCKNDLSSPLIVSSFNDVNEGKTKSNIWQQLKARKEPCTRNDLENLVLDKRKCTSIMTVIPYKLKINMELI